MRYFFLASFLLCASVFSAQLKGVNFSEKIRLENRRLILNGLGERKATLFKVSVYVAGLYLPQKMTDPEAIMKSASPKQIRLTFTRNIDADSLRKAWSEGTQKEVNCKSYCGQLQKPLEAMNAFMTDVKTSEHLILSFSSKGLLIQRPDGEQKTISDPHFAQAVLRIWLGEEPPNEDLKTGLLGGAY